MKILHIIDVNNPIGNGVAVALEKYVEHESKNNEVAVYDLHSNYKLNNYRVFKYADYSSINELPEPFNKPDIVVFNEVYKPKYIKLYKECKQNKIPYVIIPHGCLVTVAQNEKKLKKILGNMLLFNKFIKNASAIQFLNQEEKENTKFKYKKYIISGNGITASICKRKRPKDIKFVYIGRYSIYVKGLDLLVEVCAKYKSFFEKNKITFELYGRDSENGIKELESLIEQNNIKNIINMHGPVFEDTKKEVLNKAFAFIQLSRHEGQPMGIIEALAYGVPCIITYETSFGKYVESHKCGYGCNFSVDDVMEQIKKIVDIKDYEGLSYNASQNANKDFDWEHIIKKLITEYKTMI